MTIANNLGYVTAVETLKVVTEKSFINTINGVFEEKYKVAAPELMHESCMSDSDDEGCDEHLDHLQYKYMATDDLKTNEQDHQRYDTTNNDDQIDIGYGRRIDDQGPGTTSNHYALKQNNNGTINRPPVHLGFLVSFLVDARGGSMRGCRHSGVRIIVPSKACAQPTRITCRYVRPQRLNNPPSLMEAEALVSRIIELSPIEGKFLGPVILEVPHFGSLRDKEREIIILRSDNGDSWREHICDSEDSLFFYEALDGLNPLEDLHTNRIVRIITRNFPHFFAVVSRIRQEVHAIGPEGGTVSSQAVPQVQAVFPSQALTKKIRVGLQAQPVDLKDCCKLFGQAVAVSPVVTIEPRRRKFHKAITLSIPAPRACTKGMVNTPYHGNAPTLRLLCSITGGQNRAIWEDVTGTTPLAFVKDSMTFTTTVSARFWLMDCRNISEANRMATDLYAYLTRVPFMVKLVIFAKRISANEAKLSVFCMTDDKEDKTLEQQEYFIEVAKSRDVEVLEDQNIFLEFAGNLMPVLKAGEQLNLKFQAFRENRLSFIVNVRDQEEPFGRVGFMSERRVCQSELPQHLICTLNISLEGYNFIENIKSNGCQDIRNIFGIDRGLKYRNLINAEIKKKNIIAKCHAEAIGLPGEIQNESDLDTHKLRLGDLCVLLEHDWKHLAKELDVPETDIDIINKEYSNYSSKRIVVMLCLWLNQQRPQNVGSELAKALEKIGRNDILDKCIFNLEEITNELEESAVKIQLNRSIVDCRIDIGKPMIINELIVPKDDNQANILYRVETSDISRKEDRKDNTQSSTVKDLPQNLGDSEDITIIRRAAYKGSSRGCPTKYSK